MLPDKLTDLNTSEQFLIDWLSKEDWSSYGECYGKDFDRLSALGIVERKPSNRSREHEHFDLCRLTEAGQALRTRNTPE